MAQSGFTPISIYYSATATNTPTAGNLVAGELAINTADGKLFYKDSSGVVQTIASKNGVAGGSNTQVQYNSSGSLAGSANMTFNGTTFTLANDASISGLTVGKGVFTSNSGAGQVVLGDSAMVSNTSGTNNTAIGSSALNANTTAYNNVAVGFQSMYLNTTGTQNTATGFRSLRSNTTGSLNAAFGQNALYGNTTGANNTALGEEALQANTTASNNTAVGYQAGYSNTTGLSNAFFGTSAGYTNATGVAQTFLGKDAGKVSTSNSNTFVGCSAGAAVTTGASNTIIGRYDGQTGLDIRTASNNVVLSDGDGNIAARWANGGGWYQLNNSAAWSITSDARIKKNVVSLDSALDVITALRPVEFDYIKDDKHDIGFIAQEYQTVLPAQISNGEDGMLSLNQNLVPYLVKAIQELKAEFDAYKATHP